MSAALSQQACMCKVFFIVNKEHETDDHVKSKYVDKIIDRDTICWVDSYIYLKISSKQ